jgi:hypothetical protein
MNEETVANLEKRINELQTKANKPNKVVMAPNVPISLFISSPESQAAIILPVGHIKDFMIQLIGAKQGELTLTSIVDKSYTVTSISLKRGRNRYTSGLTLSDITVLHARFTATEIDETGAYVVMGGVFQGKGYFTVEKERA